MRKLIATASLASVVLFALALANAQDQSSNSGQGGVDTGITANAEPQNEQNSMDQGVPVTQGEENPSQDRWSNAATCTDHNGVTFRRGKSGFDSCINEMRRRDQLGGTAGSQNPPSNPSSHQPEGGPASGSKPQGE